MQILVGIACLLVTVLGVVFAYPQFRVALHHWRQIRAEAPVSTEPNQRLWPMSVTMGMCLCVGGLGIFLLVDHPKEQPSSVARENQPASPVAPTRNNSKDGQPDQKIPQVPTPKSTKKRPPLNPPAVVAIGPGASVHQQSKGDCSPNIIGSNNSPTCGVMPREVNPELLGEAIKPFAGINSNSFNDGSGGASRLEGAIAQALQQAGWRNGGQNVMMGNAGSIAQFDKPLVIAFNPASDDQYAKAAQALQAALAAQKVEADLRSDRRIRLDRIEIWVSAQ